MEVVLLGTGSAEGWPNPFCACASCAGARRSRELRGQTAALVDGTLLLDCGPEAPRAAERAGRSLAGVRQLLLTHAHPDHVAGAPLLWRAWAGRAEPLDVIGPEPALAACADWVGPADPVRWRPVRAGDEILVGGYRVYALAAAHGGDGSGPALLYDLTDAQGTRLLYATDTGPLPAPTLHAVRGAAYDLVLLEETFGDHTSHGTEHLDLATFPTQLAALRAVGALTRHTRVVAVHLSHHNPPTARLAPRLARWGAEALPDGTVLDVGGPSPPRPEPPRRTLVIGGARSGKSAYAEGLLAANDSVTYVATGGTRPDDPEWAQRVAVHRERRPATWRTLESTDLEPLLGAAPGDPLLVDCLTLWLTAVLDATGTWSSGTAQPARARIDGLVAALRTTAREVVLVSNEVGSGVVPATASGRLFRDELGRLNAAVAAACDEVTLLVAGRPVTL